MREIHAKNVSIIDLGRQGENLATQVIYDLSDWIAAYGDGTAELIHKRIGDSQPYPVAAVRDGNTLIWTITSTDTAVATRPLSGYGQCELRWYSGDVLAKSKTWKTMVSRAMEAPSETAPPDPEQGWVDQVLAAGASAKEAADKAFSALSNAPYIGDNGNWYLGGKDTGNPSRGEAGPALAVTNTAAVGQTVKITAVDENGQPTEWEAVDMASGGGGVEIDISREPDLILEVSEAVVSLSISEINGQPINATEMVVLWEHPSGAKYVPAYFRFNNEVKNATDASATIANFNLPDNACPSASTAAAIFCRVKKINNGTYRYEFSGLQQNAGTITGAYNDVYGGIYRNILIGETSIKEFYVYQSSNIQKGCKVSVWVK